MTSYAPSASIAELKSRHSFPWTEQRFTSPGGVLVRIIDADGVEVPIFEIAALCRIVTNSIASRDAATQSPVSNNEPVQDSNAG